MNTGLIIGVIVLVILLAGGGYWLYKSSSGSSGTPMPLPNTGSNSGSSGSSGSGTTTPTQTLYGTLYTGTNQTGTPYQIYKLGLYQLSDLNIPIGSIQSASAHVNNRVIFYNSKGESVTWTGNDWLLNDVGQWKNQITQFRIE